MDFASRLLATIALIAIAAFIVLVQIYPYHPSTTVGWGLLLVLALPIALVAEFCGERVFCQPFVAKLPRLLRIAYGVVVIGGTVAALTFALPLLDGNLSKWGT